MHNIPMLLADYRPSLLTHYWEVDRPCFLDALERIGKTAPGDFYEAWEVVESEYRRLCDPLTA
jgi:hypothetical protein